MFKSHFLVQFEAVKMHFLPIMIGLGCFVTLTIADTPCHFPCTKEYSPVCAYGKDAHGTYQSKSFSNLCTVKASNKCDKTAYKTYSVGLCDAVNTKDRKGMFTL